MSLEEERRVLAGESRLMSTHELSSPPTSGARPQARRNYWPARLRMLRVVSLATLAGLFLLVFLVGTCRVVRMIGLPDVGDPFDTVASAPAKEVPSRPGPDPMAVYEQAAHEITKFIDSQGRWTSRSAPVVVAWADAPPQLRGWVEENRGALDLFRYGAGLPGLPRKLESPVFRRFLGTTTNVGDLIMLALLEGDRKRANGDVQAAWDLYLAALRSTYHSVQHGLVIERMTAQRLRVPVAERIDAWAEDTSVNRELLQRALDDVLACRSLMPSDLETLEHEYGELIDKLDRGNWSHFGGRGNRPDAKGQWAQAREFLSWHAGRFLDNEPERSRRVLRLAFANWRAWLARPDGSRPRPAIKSLVYFPWGSQRLDFYEPGPDAPPAARRMSPGRLASWSDSCRDGRVPLSLWWSTFQSTRTAERATFRQLAVRLGEQLYLRDRGTLPPAPEALVGPYLKSLPDDGASELDDGTTPMSGGEGAVMKNDE